MIVTSSRPVKERSVASHSKYILLQPSPVGEAQGPAWHSPRKWTFGVILIWRATGTMVSKERGKENKAGREGKTGRNWSCSVPPSHVLAPPPTSEIPFLLENSDTGFPRKTSWIFVVDTHSSCLCIPQPFAHFCLVSATLALALSLVSLCACLSLRMFHSLRSWARPSSFGFLQLQSQCDSHAKEILTRVSYSRDAVNVSCTKWAPGRFNEGGASSQRSRETNALHLSELELLLYNRPPEGALSKIALTLLFSSSP